MLQGRREGIGLVQLYSRYVSGNYHILTASIAFEMAPICQQIVILGVLLEIAGCARDGGIDFANISITEGGRRRRIVDRVEIDLRQMSIKVTRKFGLRTSRLY